MTNPKTEHKTSKPTSTPHPAVHSDHAAAAPETQTAVSATMVEACDRLAEKLDELTNIFREQVQARHQEHEPAPAGSGTRRTQVDPIVDVRMIEQALEGQNARNSAPANPEIEPGQDAAMNATVANGTTGVGENARRLIDTLSRSRDDWQTQATGLQQALEAVMGFLEGQAAVAGPKVDVSEIMSRLRTLEEEQQNLRSQFNTNRWGQS